MAKNIDDWFIWVEANRDTPTRQWTEEVLPPAKQALYKDLLELVGNDNKLGTSQGKEDFRTFVTARNNLRAEIRTRLATYFGVEE